MTHKIDLVCQPAASLTSGNPPEGGDEAGFTSGQYRAQLWRPRVRVSRRQRAWNHTHAVMVAVSFRGQQRRVHRNPDTIAIGMKTWPVDFWQKVFRYAKYFDFRWSPCVFLMLTARWGISTVGFMLTQTPSMRDLNFGLQERTALALWHFMLCP